MKKRENKKTNLFMRLSPIALALVLNAPAFSQDLDKKLTDKTKVEIDKTYVHSTKSKLDFNLMTDEEIIASVNKGIANNTIGTIVEVKKDDKKKKEVVAVVKADDKKKKEVVAVVKADDKKKKDVVVVTKADDKKKKDEVVVTKNDDKKKKDEVVVKDNKEHNELVQEIKTKISETGVKISTLLAEVKKLDGEVEQKEKDSLQARVDSLKTQLADLEKRANDIPNFDGCEDDEKMLKSSLEVSSTDNNETIKLISKLKVVETEEIVVDSEVEVTDTEGSNEDQLKIEELKKKNAELENAICKQENKMAKLEKQMTSSSQNMMAPFMMQQQFAMMNMFMNGGFPTTYAPSYSSGSDSLRMEMMLQSMRFENSISNMNSNMFNMMGLMAGMNSAPTYNVGGDYIGGNYSINNPGQIAAHSRPDAYLQGTMALTQPYAPNLNQDPRFGNMLAKPQVKKKKAKTLDTAVETEDLASVGGKMIKNA
jgi:hypothetical protein